MTSVISDRVGIRKAARDVLTEGLDDTTTVSYGLPKADQEQNPDEWVGVGTISGELSTVRFGGGGAGTQDSFRLRIGVRVQIDGADQEQADERCQVIVTDALDLLLKPPRLNLPNVAVRGGTVEGPDGSPTDGSSAVSEALIEVQITAPLAGS
jgi:hypothetical protein